MRAITYSEFGAAQTVLNLTELPTPTPGPGEVLVRLRISGVNPSDVKARAGARPGVTKPPFAQIIPHSDGAGVIEAVGAGVSDRKTGQRVWIWNGQWQRAFGTCASHICVPAEQAVPMPDTVSDETGAQLGIPGLTAMHAVFAGGDVAGKTVLIHGAAGSVGYLAAQAAAWAGARVIATARGDGLDRVTSLGLGPVLDFSSDGLAAQILEAAEGPIDHIVDVEFGQNADTNAQVIRENGTVCAYGSAQAMRPEIPFYPLMFKAVTLSLVLIYILPPMQRTAAITRLHRCLEAGALHAPVAVSFALQDTHKAHAVVETGVRNGAVLVQCD